MLNSPTDYLYQKFTVGFENTLTTFERAEHHDATYVDSRRLQAAFFGLRRPDGLPAASAGSIRAASESQFEGQTAATNEPVSGPLFGALSCENTHSISRSPTRPLPLRAVRLLCLT